MSRNIDDRGIDWDSFAKEARVQLWCRIEGTPVTNLDVNSISQLVNEASSAEKYLFLFDRMITAIRFCRFSVQDGALPRARDIVVAELLREV